MHKPEEIATWSLNRPRKNAERQLKLLLNGLKSLRIGGRLVYSTCSLAAVENDELVTKAVRKCKGTAAVVPPPSGLPFGEPTKLGWIVLPDNNAAGWGPLYFAVLTRVEAKDGGVGGVDGAQSGLGAAAVQGESDDDGGAEDEATGDLE